MTNKLLKKGLEVELYAGTSNGEVLPLSGLLSKKFSYISQEPDQRNFEYITNPTIDYTILHNEIIEPRLTIRKFLQEKDNLVLIPGSTIPLPFSKEFYSSKPDDPYHEYIATNYKTNIITTSLHINFGIDDYNNLFNLLSALRLDMPLILALSASSPFHDGKVTGYQSFRWHSFPKTPSFVPIFSNHEEYIKWTEEKLSKKEMQNVRHLWTSIRPNGPNRPYNLNRIEIRICDLVANTTNVLAIISFIECLIQKYLIENKWPNVIATNKNKLNELVQLLDLQEKKVAKEGLNTTIWDWRNDTENKCQNVIDSLYKELEDMAKKIEVLKYFERIQLILQDGNEATQFIETYKNNNSIQQTIQHFINQFTIMDLKSRNMIRIS